MRFISGNLDAEMAGDAAREADLLIDWPGIVLCAAGLVLLGLWLWRYGGLKALRRAPIRRHCVPVWLPFLLLFVWFLVLYQLSSLIDLVFDETNAPGATAGRNLMMLVMNVLLIAGMLAAGYALFARRLKGFGFNPKTLLKDTGWASVNLLAIYPLVIGGVMLVTLAGRLLTGKDFSIQTHESLEELMRFEQVWVRVLVIVLVAGVVPVMEEMLFRGLMQSAVRGVLGKAWPAVLITSALFASVHSPTHIPAIFALSCGLGYAYERSGSLFRPIAMHILFNATSVAAVLLV